MENKINFKKYAILYVDDEEKSLQNFKRAFKDEFKIITATNAEEGFRIFEDHKNEIGLLITDQRMSGEKGVELLKKARRSQPHIIRILVTAYSDIDAAIDAVNAGAIYKYITKPWNIAELKLTLKRGLDFFIVQNERNHLMQEKFSVLRNMVIADRVISLGVLAAGLGHYVRNSLVAVRTFLDLAPTRLKEERVNLDDLHNPKFWKEFYDHVQKQVRRILKLLEDLGGATENTTTTFQDELHLNEVIEAVLKRLSNELTEKEITITKVIPDELPNLIVDSAKFHRLFELLIKDEIINLPTGSEILIRAESLNPEVEDGFNIKVEILDNGPGLPEEELSSVFDPFYLRNGDPQEFGINLMACYFIVYHHGGKIDIENNAEKGTKFVLTLKAQTPTPDPQNEEREFLGKVLMNEKTWEKMLSDY